MNRMLVIAALTALVPAALPAQTQATTEASITGAEINACYVKNTGTMYRVGVPNTPDKCATNHTSFSWTAAPSGLTGYRRVSTGKLIGSQTTDFTPAYCSADEVVLGGGYEASDVNGNWFQNLTVARNGPTPVYLGSPPPGWGTVILNQDPSLTIYLTVYAICAKTPAN